MIDVIGNYPDFLLTAKPPGLDFHDCDGQPGFFSALKAQLQPQPIWPVHRLDKPTSGLIVVAKNEQAAAAFGELFASGKVRKQYLALAEGTPKKKQGTVKGDMARSRRGSWRLQRSTNNPAITQFRSQSLWPKCRLYHLQPSTGKTHQLRVAMKSLGVPILGDTLYGGSESDRLYLHAYGLAFDWLGGQLAWHLSPTRGTLFNSPEFVTALKAEYDLKSQATNDGV